ncbi:MAG: hypothetical protein Q7J72_07580 [Candidatus Omnitrophota bacterium]|nr:hypothetical protein [Candidatus Omnitrophota bacterium]
MNTRWMHIVCLHIFLAGICLSRAFAQEKLSAYPAVIHIHSTISQADYPPRRIVSLAREQGIRILVFTDSFIRRWEYGLPLVSNIFKFSAEEDSISRYGIKRYLNDFKKIKDEFPDMLILEGAEVAPFYWWSGSFFKKNLSLNDWSRHLLVIGLKKEQDYRHLPVVGNKYFFPRLKDMFFLLIAAILIIPGIFFLKRKQKKALGFLICAAGILFLLNSIPFSASRYSPYHRQKQYLPYQDLIEYVTKKNALVFWAHPRITEEVSWGRYAKTVNFFTLKYPEALTLTSGYTGFGVGANRDLILAGEEWDNVLNSYCDGRRANPAWVIAEADYRGRGQIDSIQNMIFLPVFKEESVYEALRAGRLYIRYYSENKCDILLEDFHIADSPAETSGSPAFIAGEITIKNKPRLLIRGSSLISPPEELRIEVIRNGRIVKEFRLAGQKEFDLGFQDDSLEITDRKNYYRLNFFIGNNVVLATNPIFVRIKNEAFPTL